MDKKKNLLFTSEVAFVLYDAIHFAHSIQTQSQYQLQELTELNTITLVCHHKEYYDVYLLGNFVKTREKVNATNDE